MSLSSNLSPRRTSMVREESTISMEMVLRTTSRDQETSSIDSTTLTNSEMPEMIFTTPIMETFQDISDLRSTKSHQRKESSMTSPHPNTSIPTSSMVEPMTQHLPLPKPKTPISSHEHLPLDVQA